jgi:hypothetical protein
VRSVRHEFNGEHTRIRLLIFYISLSLSKVYFRGFFLAVGQSRWIGSSLVLSATCSLHDVVLCWFLVSSEDRDTTNEIHDSITAFFPKSKSTKATDQ